MANNWPMLKEKSAASFSDKDKARIDSISEKFRVVMNNDFNTPQALACLFELIDLGKRFVSSDKKDAFNYTKTKLEEIFNILGLKVKPKEKMNPEVKKLIRDRDKAKQDKDFNKADSIREKIENEFGYCVSDTSSNVTISSIALTKK
jgi:cysteinyl-tRNA synthetase